MTKKVASILGAKLALQSKIQISMTYETSCLVLMAIVVVVQ